MDTVKLLAEISIYKQKLNSIVHCKDCKYWAGTPHNPICTYFDALEIYSNDFCSRGEKKDEED